VSAGDASAPAVSSRSVAPARHHVGKNLPTGSTGGGVPGRERRTGRGSDAEGGVTMIPENITRQSMLDVIRKLEAGSLSVPPAQRSTGYCLEYEGFHYPPKYVVRIANVDANGEELWEHYGGEETNDFCECRGFLIVECGGAPHSA